MERHGPNPAIVRREAVSGEAVCAYDRGFRELSALYEAFGFDDIHRGALAFLPATAGVVLDIGAGSGRDAAWFASCGWDVVAVEPAPAMRAEAMRTHPSPRIRWLDDSLPALSRVHRLGLAFDLVWLSGVWMHIAPADRARAMRTLATLLKPGGRLMLTLRHGPAPDDRPMWPVDAHEVERLGLDLGLALRVATEHADDLQGRADVRWQTVVLDLPDDGAGALPLLRGVILRQEKSATYKLALRMGFATDAFRALRSTPAGDLRPGAELAGAQGEALRRALADASRLIAAMPATHLTFADDTPVFPTTYGRMPPPGRSVAIEQGFLWQYGTTRVPLLVWHALRRMAAWIEPMLVAEWVRLTQSYAQGMGRTATADEVLAALRWTEPERDTGFVRALALRRLAGGRPVVCVWSGRKLVAGALDIDHCLPWSAWPCGDLWNLLPAAPSVNRQGKRERIVSGAALVQARPLILEWWQDAYLGDDPTLRARFTEEAQTTLPIARDRGPDLEELFQALDFRRLRLRQDTQVAEWAGVG